MAKRRRRRGTTASGVPREERRRQLLDAAERVIRRDGAGASMEAMAAEAGVTKPILYRHFGSKEGLADALADRYINGLGAVIEQALSTTDDPRRRLKATIDAYLAMIELHPEIYRFLLDGSLGAAPAAVDDFISQMTLRLTFVLAVEFRRFGIDPQLAEPYANAFVGMVRQVGDWWLANQAVDRADLADQLVRLVWTGLVGMADPAAVARDQAPTV